jgi:hypothetical protein
MLMRSCFLFFLLLALLLAGCVSPQPRVQWDDLQAMRQQADQRGRTLDVQPFVDAGLAALLQRLDRAEAEGELEQAALWLDRAASVAGEDDPLILQRRAELALLTADFDRAQQLARSAFEAGPKAGPLCLRSIETVHISQGRLLGGESGAAPASAYQVCLPDRPARL